MLWSDSGVTPDERKTTAKKQRMDLPDLFAGNKEALEHTATLQEATWRK
jgi:hypothetical protein